MFWNISATTPRWIHVSDIGGRYIPFYETGDIVNRAGAKIYDRPATNGVLQGTRDYGSKVYCFGTNGMFWRISEKGPERWIHVNDIGGRILE